ncbi:LysM domain-containing protein [Ligilactobacillus sp. 110_WCHN]|uniref:LysM peptidoglycan-binding domain-containing protein n=1 Tax=Ligilactobacillus sp. 110_WCHN TaxID=3057125 RepID=UPI00267146ED|nr:LysM domain-containing protein [Ligilactobacillus sp. 110_WCHN]MDO3393970.1 LysM domain-containing protein [Ligilactobacillus sp. 110_WCHN]
MTLSRMEKYHNNKNKKFKKSIATALMGTVLVAPIALSSASVNADTVPAGSQPAQTEWVANSVSTVRAEMQAQGLNLSHVQGKYIVRKGDTLLAISQAANESMAEIAKVNHITNLNLIYVGQVLYLGSNGVVKAQSASANNEVANNAGTGVAANVMSNGGNATGASIATPANNGIYRGFTGNGTVAAHPSRTAEQARNAAKVGLSTNTSANSHTAVKTDTSAKVDPSTKASAKTTSAVKSSAKASSAKTDTSKVSSSASSVKSSVASSTASSAKHSSAVSSSTPAKTSSATSSSASHVSNSTASKVDTPTKAPTNTSSASSSKAPVASSTTSSQAQSSQKPATSTTSSSTQTPAASTSSSVDYDKGVVNSDGTVNYQAAINQKGPWQGKSATPNAQGQSPAEQEWLKDHPGARMSGSQYADGSENEVPVYANNQNDDIDRPAMTQQQLQDANTQMQKNINAPETFGNGIQWVSSDYKGEVTGTATPVNATNPEQTPYEPYANTVGRVDANIVKQDYGKQPVAPTNMSNGDMKAPDGSHYVSSNITNGQGTTNKVTLTFYK